MTQSRYPLIKICSPKSATLFDCAQEACKLLHANCPKRLNKYRSSGVLHLTQTLEAVGFKGAIGDFIIFLQLLGVVERQSKRVDGIYEYHVMSPLCFKNVVTNTSVVRASDRTAERRENVNLKRLLTDLCSTARLSGKRTIQLAEVEELLGVTEA